MEGTDHIPRKEKGQVWKKALLACCSMTYGSISTSQGTPPDLELPAWPTCLLWRYLVKVSRITPLRIKEMLSKGANKHMKHIKILHQYMDLQASGAELAFYPLVSVYYCLIMRWYCLLPDAQSCISGVLLLVFLPLHQLEPIPWEPNAVRKWFLFFVREGK